MKTSVLVWLTLSFLLSACGGKSGITGLPALHTGETRIYHYNCAGGEGLDVEYAQMGGSYSATMKIEAAKKVLNQENAANMQRLFRLDDWRWESADNYRFQLWQHNKLLRSDCVAMNEAARDEIRGVRESFLNHDENK